VECAPHELWVTLLQSHSAGCRPDVPKLGRLPSALNIAIITKIRGRRPHTSRVQIEAIPFVLSPSLERPTYPFLRKKTNTPSTMKFVLPFILGLARFANTAAIPSQGNELEARADQVTTEASTGYRSVAYFVNWVSVFHAGNK
jgi:hypothetical protein